MTNGNWWTRYSNWQQFLQDPIHSTAVESVELFGWHCVGIAPSFLSLTHLELMDAANLIFVRHGFSNTSTNRSSSPHANIIFRRYKLHVCVNVFVQFNGVFVVLLALPSHRLHSKCYCNCVVVYHTAPADSKYAVILLHQAVDNLFKTWFGAGTI